MTHSHSHTTGPSLSSIERPACPQCDSRMHLALIKPGPAGFDLRHFECEKCAHVTTVTVAIDPMKSDKTGWLAGELKPPR